MSLLWAIPAVAAQTKAKSSVLITDANIFDGINEKLADGTSAQVENRTTRAAGSDEVYYGLPHPFAEAA